MNGHLQTLNGMDVQNLSVFPTGQYNYNPSGVLNLTQDHQQLNGRQQQQQQQQQLQLQQQQQYGSTFLPNASLEVGLNLSVQVLTFRATISARMFSE
jgi:hypothetical protein